MDFSRLRTGELVAGGSGVALFILAFISWFEVSGVAGFDFGGLGEATGVEAGVSGWQSFGFLGDLILIATIIIAVGGVLLAASSTDVGLPVATSALTAGAGIVCTLMIIYRIIDPPGPSEVDVGRQIGVFLGLIASAGIAFGGWQAMQEEQTPTAGSPPPPPAA